MDLHKFFNSEPFEWRNNRFELLLHKDCIKAILVTNRLKNVKLNQGQAVTLAVFKFLKELRLSLVVQVGVLEVLSVFQPDS